MPDDTLPAGAAPSAWLDEPRRAAAGSAFPRRAVGIGLLAAVLACAAVATWRHAQFGAEFDRFAAATSRTLAQRIDQHDAHLTSLAAVAQAADGGHGTFVTVADAVRRFYPRIVSIDLVQLDGAPRRLAASGRPAAAAPLPWEALAEKVQGLTAGKAGLLRWQSPPGYLLVKRLGGTPLRALVLTIDGRQLAAIDELRPNDRLALLDAGGSVLTRVGDEGRRFIAPALTSTQTLPSGSQPLAVQLERTPMLRQLLPWDDVLAVLLGAGALVWLQVTLRRARLARTQAARQARELRLAHAMRVNGLGEMASGIAHELTQPLTAMLSQNQAAVRLAQGGAPAETLLPILQSNVALSKRAGDILARMRSYVSRQPPRVQACDLNALLDGVADLVAADLRGRGIVFDVVHAPAGTQVLADTIGVQQVVHNLLRNAREALAGRPGGAEGGRVTLAAAATASGASIEVADDGPGIAAADLPHLFTPFFTSKADGMGLGLPLCERLADAMGGRIELASPPGEGARFILHLRRAEPAQPGTTWPR